MNRKGELQSSKQLGQRHKSKTQLTWETLCTSVELEPKFIHLSFTCITIAAVMNLCIASLSPICLLSYFIITVNNNIKFPLLLRYRKVSNFLNESLLILLIIAILEVKSFPFHLWYAGDFLL